MAVVLWGASGSNGSKALAQKGVHPPINLVEIRYDGETGRNGRCCSLLLNSGTAKPAVEPN
jgi:hypothetical protein